MNTDIDKRFDDVGRRSADIDKRFDEVIEAIAEQRQYTEYAFDTLHTEMQTGLTRLERKIDGLDDRFDSFERKLDRILDTRARTKAPRRRS